MNVFKPRQLLLALRMRQLSIPLVFFEYKFFVLKSEFLHTYSMLEKSRNRVSLVENGNRTSECAPMEYPDSRITKKTMENPAPASEQPYLDSVIFIFHHTHSHSGRFENSLSYMYQWITFATIECGRPGLSASITDVLPVIYCYQLLILVKKYISSSYIP